MPVYLDDIKFTSALDSTPVNWLLAAVGDEIVIEHSVSVSTSVLSSTPAPMVLNNTNGYLDHKNVTGGDFSKFNVGDTIMIYNYIQTLHFGFYTITGKPNNSTLFLNIPVGSNYTPGGPYAPINPVTDNASPELAVSLATKATALLYKWNFIKNSENANYFSKVDGSVQVASVSGIDPVGGGSSIPMNMLGGLPYQVGSITVDEVSLTTTPIYSSNFKIKHRTRVTPVMLAEDWDDTVNGIAPDYFFNLECLKACFYYEARYDVSDPNAPQTLQVENILGNTGWFNEKWNANATNYSIEDLDFFYMNAGSPVSIPGVEASITRNTNFSFKIRNTTDSPFVAGSTKLVLNFNKAPNGSSEYTANGRDMLHNFVWETAILTASASPTLVNGDNFSDPSIRSLADLQAFFVSANEILVTGKFLFDQAAIDVFEESNTPNYMFFATIQDHAKTGALGDRVALRIDFNNFFYQTDFPNLFTLNTKIIPHDVPDYTTSFINRKRFTEDELVGYTSATIVPDPLVTSLVINKVTYNVLAYNTTTNDSFILESRSINLPNNYLVGGYQYFDIDLDKNIRVPANEIRKHIIAKRDTTGLDYEFAFPFLMRWEYWKSLMNVDPAFFNIASPNNGLNNNWVTYSNQSNWVIRYETELACRINDIPSIYTSHFDVNVLDRNLPFGGDGYCEINTYDPDSLTPLEDASGKKFILGYKNTLVEAIGVLDSHVAYDFDQSNTHVVLGIEVFEQGGVAGKRRMSSKYPSDGDTWFIPLAGQAQTKLTFTNLTVKAEALIDFTKLDLSKSKWKLSARLYGNGTGGQNLPYLKSEEVYMIPENPIFTETIVGTPKKLDCCSDLVFRVLADSAGNEFLKNDVNNFIWWYNKDVIDTAVLKLVKSDGTEIDLTADSTYGTPYDYGFEIIPGVTFNGFNKKAVGYKIEWRKVLLEEGEDTYYIKCIATTIFGGADTKTSPTFCLKQYTEARANGTVRIEYLLNGIIGDNKQDIAQRDYLQSNWYNQYRLDGVFHYINSSYTTEEVVYQNGLSETVEDEQTTEYVLKLKPITAYKHDLLRTDILMSDSVVITDYNNRNIDNYYQKEVIKNGGYDPKWHVLQSKIALIEIKFKQAYNNLKKFRS